VLLLAAAALTTSLLLCPTSARAQGGVPLWTNRYDGGFCDHDASAIAVDSGGNVFVTGFSGPCGNGNGWDFATVAYSNAGVALWTNRYDGPANSSDSALAIAVDGSGNVFVTGESLSNVAAGDTDYATIKYSNEGVPLWTNRYSGPSTGEDRATAIVVDRSGNVIVTGESFNGSDYDYATIKYSNDGVPLWTNRFSKSGRLDVPNAIACDSSGNVIVTGVSYTGFVGTGDFVTMLFWDGEGHRAGPQRQRVRDRIRHQLRLRDDQIFFERSAPSS
jgi:hypothetical protein